MNRIICTVCPRGCEMEVVESNGELQVLKNGCSRGEVYAKSEYVHPVRLFTSLVRVEGGREPLIPVRSTKPIPRELQRACVDELRKIVLEAPVDQYTVVLENVFGTGADIVTSSPMQ